MQRQAIGTGKSASSVEVEQTRQPIRAYQDE
jgi:triosephosphate isomerase